MNKIYISTTDFETGQHIIFFINLYCRKKDIIDNFCIIKINGNINKSKRIIALF